MSLEMTMFYWQNLGKTPDSDVTNVGKGRSWLLRDRPLYSWEQSNTSLCFLYCLTTWCRIFHDPGALEYFISYPFDGTFRCQLFHLLVVDRGWGWISFESPLCALEHWHHRFLSKLEWNMIKFKEQRSGIMSLTINYHSRLKDANCECVKLRTGHLSLSV